MDKQQIISADASTSNSFTTVSFKKYDVFLSFRGEDTRRNFTSHLHNALKQKKVETYIDYRLEKGDEISPALIKAIEDSHISLIVFSENYASSKWCLAELNKILECKKDQGQVVIPVFYNIDPSHVRKQIGSYKQAFAKHEGEPKCNKWKTALTEAANLAGWDSQTYRFFDDCIKCKEENEHYTALCIKDSKERIRKMFNNVELSVSSYDTAWVAMIPCPSSSHAPFFPWCMNWFLGNQLFDGSWGLPTRHPLLMNDALFSTLSYILALKAIGCW